MTGSGAVSAALAGLLLGGCVVADVDLSGKPCPCAKGWLCDDTRNVCVKELPPPDARPADATMADAADAAVDAAVDDGTLPDAAPEDGGLPDAEPPHDAGPPDTAGAIPVSHAAVAPTIGTGSGWYEDNHLFDFTTAYQGGNNSVQVYGQWDEAAIYLAAVVSDTQLYADITAHDDGMTYDNDTIELMFDPSLKGGPGMTYGDPAFRHYIFTIAGGFLDAYGCSGFGDPAFEGTATFHPTLYGTLNGTGTGFLMEMRIPWSDLVFTPSSWDFIGFDVANSDRDSTSLADLVEADWRQISGSYAQPSLWGRLVLLPP